MNEIISNSEVRTTSKLPFYFVVWKRNKYFVCISVNSKLMLIHESENFKYCTSRRQIFPMVFYSGCNLAGVSVS